jgi:hypothetical protein
MSINSKQMADMFGADNIASCIEVTDRLVNAQAFGKPTDGWRMVRTFRYADGREVEMAPENSEFFVCIPAAPGWVQLAVAKPEFGDPLAGNITRREILAWRFDCDGCGSGLFPLYPGEHSWMGGCARAMQAPDGRVIHEYGADETHESAAKPFLERVFESADAWLAWVSECWAEVRRREEARRANTCPQCGRTNCDSDFPF